MIASVAHVDDGAPVLGAERQRHEADDFGRERFRIGRMAVGENFRDATQKVHQKPAHLLVRLEPAARMILDGGDPALEIGRGNADDQRFAAALDLELEARASG